MTITKDKMVFTDACLDTPFDALCVKKHGANIKSALDDFGIIVTPAINRRYIKAPDDLNGFIAALDTNATVKVRGHGWTDSERFVWSGTPEEFNSIWVVD